MMEARTIRVLGGISQEAAQYVTEAGSWESLTNVELGTDGVLRKRRGLTELPARGALPIAALNAHNDAVLAQGRDGTEVLWSESVDSDYVARADYRREWEAGSPSAATVLTRASAARAGKWLVVSSPDRLTVVIDTDTNTAVSSLTLDEHAYDLMGSGDYVLAIATFGGSTYRRVLDTTSPIPVWGPLITTGAFSFALCAVPGTGWALVATSMGTDLLLLDYTGAVTAFLTISAGGPVAATATHIYIADSTTSVTRYTVTPLALDGTETLAGTGGDIPAGIAVTATERVVLFTDMLLRHSWLRGTTVDYGVAWWAKPVSGLSSHAPGVSWWTALGAAHSTAITEPSAGSFALLYGGDGKIRLSGIAAYGEMPFARASFMAGGLLAHDVDAQRVSVLVRQASRSEVVPYVLGHAEDAPIPRGAVHAGATLLTSGAPRRWVAGGTVETAGYAAAPVIQSAVPVFAGGSGFMVPGVYRYQAVYERYQSGRLVRSAASPPAVVTLAGGASTENGVDLQVRVISATDAYAATHIALYRSAVDAPLGAAMHLVSRRAQGDVSGDLVDFADRAADATIQANEILYTVDGYLDADPVPGGARYVHTHKDRVAAVGMERDDVVWMSQPQQPGVATEFSIGLLLELPGERLLALASLDDALVIFGAERSWLAFGQGPAPSGDPQTGGWEVIPLDVPPLRDPRSVVQTPIGVMYASVRGFELIDQSRTAQPMGRAVQREVPRATPILGSTYVQHRGEVHWLTPDLRVVLNLMRASATVDPRRGVDAGPLRWSTWSHSRLSEGITSPLLLTGIVAAANGRVTALAPSGWYRDSSGYTDPGGAWYGTVVSTPHLHLDATEMRVRRVEATVRLGRGRSGLRLIAETEEGLLDEHEWGPDDVIAQRGGGGYATLIAPMAAPLCDTLSLVLEETRGDNDSQGLDLLTLDIWVQSRGSRKRAGGDYR